MARRDYAQLYTRIWSDPDFRERGPDAQRLYMLLLSQASLDYAGVTPLFIRRWANCSRHTTVADTETALAELEQHRYVVVDHDTEELLVRSFIRNDELWKQPRMLGLALREALDVQSPKLRATLSHELRRLPDSARVDKGAPTIAGTAQLLSGGGPPPPPPPGSGHAAGGGASPNGRAVEGVTNGLPETDADGASIVAATNVRCSWELADRGDESSQVAGPEVPPDEGVTQGIGQGTCARAPAAPGTWHLAPSTNTKPSSPRSARAIDDADFAAFYDAYPRHVGRKHAEKAWRAAVRNGADSQTLIDAAKRYADSRHGQDQKFTKHPATWLNGGCWDDEPEPPKLKLVAGGYQPWTNPPDQSVYDEDLLP